MNNIYIFISIIIFFITFVRIYLNFLKQEKNQINKMIEFKNFLSSLYNVNNYKIIDLLKNEIKKIKYNKTLKKAIIKLYENISKEEIFDFNEHWEIFIDEILTGFKEKFYNDLNIKENLKYYGKILCSYEEKNKHDILNELMKIINDNIVKSEIEFNKRKNMNFKYLVVCIILVIVLSV